MKKSLIISITFIFILSITGCTQQECEVNIELVPEEAYKIYKETISTILKGSIHTRMYEVDLSDDNFDKNFYIFNSDLGSYRNPFD